MKHYQSPKTLDQWLSYYEQLHPVGIDMGLVRVGEVWQALCQRDSIQRIATHQVITVAGTNGKGSTCQMLSLLLQDNHNKVGMYTSPHIHRFNERIQINQQAIDDAQIIDAFETIEAVRGDITLSYFEATTLAGLLIFARQHIDYAVLEVGLGGRLDAINILDADAAIITAIGLDHEDYLGHDVSQIAVEKMGVCRPQHPAVYGDRDCYQTVENYANNHSIALTVRGKDYHMQGNKVVFAGRQYALPDSLAKWGRHQFDNAAAVVVLLAIMGLLPNDYQARLREFALPGRLQVIANSPTVIVDVAHNPNAAQSLAMHIRSQSHQGKLYAVIGMLKDKDHRSLLSTFTNCFDHVFFGTTSGQRGFSGEQLLGKWQTISSIPASSFENLPSALLAAKAVAKPNDTIYAFGSFLVVEALTV